MAPTSRWLGGPHPLGGQLLEAPMGEEEILDAWELRRQRQLDSLFAQRQVDRVPGDRVKNWEEAKCKNRVRENSGNQQRNQRWWKL